MHLLGKNLTLLTDIVICELPHHRMSISTLVTALSLPPTHVLNVRSSLGKEALTKNN